MTVLVSAAAGVTRVAEAAGLGVEETQSIGKNY